MTSSTLSRLLPSLVSLIFWRKKPRQQVSEATAAASPEIDHAVSESDASRSREILKVLKLEREIVGTALTTIYESEAQGIITRDERDRLIDKYSTDLKQLESKISEHQRIVDIFDLEAARKELLDSYQEKMSEIDKKLGDLRKGVMPELIPTAETTNEQPVTPRQTVVPATQSSPKTTKAEVQDFKAKTEKRIEAIREEVLKAMDRLEQIESEG